MIFPIFPIKSPWSVHFALPCCPGASGAGAADSQALGSPVALRFEWHSCADPVARWKEVILQAKNHRNPLNPSTYLGYDGMTGMTHSNSKEKDWTELYRAFCSPLPQTTMAGLGQETRDFMMLITTGTVWGYPLRPKGTRLITTGSTSIFKATCVQFFPDTPFLSGQRLQFLHCKVGFSQRVLLHHGRSCPLSCFWGIPMWHQELARSWNTSYRTTFYVITMQVNQANHQLKHQLVGKILCKCNTSQTW